MAITKIIHMKDSGRAFHGKHLKQGIDYILKDEKTQNGKLTGAVNCMVEQAYEQMENTKKLYLKVDKRQGYHIIISFPKDEVTVDTAYVITEKFVTQYLGSDYEAVYAVHDNTEHIHSHIIFNSVSFRTGRKYRYEKGDWEKTIQPLVNSICREFGLSMLEVAHTDEIDRQDMDYPTWSREKQSDRTWNDMIRRDIDACVLLSDSFEEFIAMMQNKGYEIKEGKYLSIRPPGMQRFRRVKTLGEEYAEEYIRERIRAEQIKDYKLPLTNTAPRIVGHSVKRYRRKPLSAIQKRYFARLYKAGRLKRRSYSQAWKYKDDIEKMEQLQRQYLFLCRRNIQSNEQLYAELTHLEEHVRMIQSEKRKLYREKKRFISVFQLAEDIESLLPSYLSYEQGDVFFQNEWQQYNELVRKLQKEGYTPEEVQKLKCFYDTEIKVRKETESAVKKEASVAGQIWREIERENQCKREELAKKMQQEQEVKKQEEKKYIHTKQPRL